MRNGRRATVIQTPPTRRGGADRPRQGWSLALGAPLVAKRGRLRSARGWGVCPSHRYDCRKISTFLARISQTARDACGTFLMRERSSVSPVSGSFTTHAGPLLATAHELKRRGEPQGQKYEL